MTTITLSPDGERFKVKIDKPGIITTHWYNQLESALLKVAAERVRCKQLGIVVTFINEAERVQSAAANL